MQNSCMFMTLHNMHGTIHIINSTTCTNAWNTKSVIFHHGSLTESRLSSNKSTNLHAGMQVMLGYVLPLGLHLTGRSESRAIWLIEQTLGWSTPHQWWGCLLWFVCSMDATTSLKYQDRFHSVTPLHNCYLHGCLYTEVGAYKHSVWANMNTKCHSHIPM